MASAVPVSFVRRNDKFKGAVVDESSATWLGGILSLVAYPALVLGLVASWIVTFYGLNRAMVAGHRPGPWRVVQSEILPFGSKVFELNLECQNSDGCYFRTPEGGAERCAAESWAATDFECFVNTNDFDLCPSGKGSGGGGGGASGGGGGGGGGSPPSGGKGAGRRLVGNAGCIPDAACHKASCGEVVGAADAVCAYIDEDPQAALTVSWKHEDNCIGGCKFGIKLLTHYKSEADGKVYTRRFNVHKGFVLLNLVERIDPKLEWADGTNGTKGKTLLEWTMTPVEATGTYERPPGSNCHTQMCEDWMPAGTPCGGTQTELSAYQVTLLPFPTYTRETVTYPGEPWYNLLLLLSGVYGSYTGTAMQLLGLVLAAAGIASKPWSKLKKRPGSKYDASRVEPSSEVEDRRQAW